MHNIKKNCYGLLGYRDSSFWQLETSEYSDMLEAVLETQFESEDRLLHRLAHQFAGVMLSSGNMKKHSKMGEIVESIYAPIIPDEPVEPVVKDRSEKTLQETQQFISELQNDIENNLRGKQ